MGELPGPSYRRQSGAAGGQTDLLPAQGVEVEPSGRASAPHPCKPDSTGADWFACSRGTVGCPYVHDHRSPHCIACEAGEPCRFRHDPPVLEEARRG
jgi:hypothetical protein